MKKILRPLFVLLLVAGCSLPRGAALQSEILKEQNAQNPQIAVYPVTRSFLPQVARWPYTGGGRVSNGWLNHGNVSAELKIQPFDLVDLIIWDSEENALLASPGQKLVEMLEMRVNENGSIFVPYLGLQRIADKTPEAARAQIEREIMQIIPSAQVQLRHRGGRRSTVSLVSGVGAPGPIEITDGQFSVLNLIAQGGGPRSGMRNPRVRLIRGSQTYATSLKSLYENPSKDTVLKGGDKVVVEEDNRYFRALGASGLQELVYFPKESVSALDAISLIGGISPTRADPKGVLILRNYPAGAVRSNGVRGPSNQRVVFTINLTTADGLFSAESFEINPKDTVLVTESPVVKAQTIFGLVGGVAGLSNQVSQVTQ